MSESPTAKVAYISMDKEGRFIVDYVSYSTGEPTLQRAIGTHLDSLTVGIKKNRETYKKMIEKELLHDESERTSSRQVGDEVPNP